MGYHHGARGPPLAASIKRWRRGCHMVRAPQLAGQGARSGDAGPRLPPEAGRAQVRRDGDDVTCPPHHWLFETPAGPMVHGVCLKCGEETEAWSTGEPPFAPVDPAYAAFIGRPVPEARHEKLASKAPRESGNGIRRPKGKGTPCQR